MRKDSYYNTGIIARYQGDADKFYCLKFESTQTYTADYWHEECRIFTARAMLSAVLGVVILSVCPSVTRVLC